VKDWANTRKETHIVSVNTYETVFIAEPEISNDQVDQLISKIKQAITTHQGTVTGEDRWGRRRLAYPIHGHREGFYAVMNFTAAAEVVNAIEHLYNVTDSVVRHLTTRVIKKNKTFRPRREKPAGHTEGSRHGGPRAAGTYRPRTDTASHATPPPAGGGAKPAAPAAETLPAGQAGAAPTAPAPAPAGNTPEGGTPA
jgi:small subunit ribosomal protein S6